jgi:hypothetical protein
MQAVKVRKGRFFEDFKKDVSLPEGGFVIEKKVEN